MPGDGTGVGISNWILNQLWNETNKVPGVCEIKVPALPQYHWHDLKFRMEEC